jgi:uncharacterized protein involved in exopolysaccharide biosynthesis
VDRLPVGWDEGPGLVASVWRYRWLVAAVALAGALAGFGVSLVQPVMYEASSRVLLTAPASDQEPDRFVRNEAALMVSPPVLDRAVRGVKGRVTVKQLRERLVAEPSTESDLVTLRVQDTTAQGAAELVAAVGSAYEATVVERARAVQRRAVEQARAIQKTLRDRLAGLDAKLEASPDDRTLRSQRNAIAGLLAQAVLQEQQLQLNGPAEDPVSLLEQPEVPDEPAQPKPLRLVVLGGLLGSVLAAVLAWWLAGSRQPPAISPQPGWPAPLPGAKRAGFRARLGGKLRSRLPKRGAAAPDVPAAPAPNLRADPEHARERLVAVLGSERRRQHRAGPGVQLGDESERLNGHHWTGNGSGARKAAATPDESNDEASPHG